jgi:MYXO-CTERM domain-containing protein
LPGATWISHAMGDGLATHRIDGVVAQAGFGCSAAVGGGVPSLLLTALGLAAIALHIASNRRPRL